MELAFTPAALKSLKALPKADAKRLVEALQLVAEQHPERMSFVTELTGGEGLWRARKGDYRAVYRVTATAIMVEAVGNRKDIYE